MDFSETSLDQFQNIFVSKDIDFITRACSYGKCDGSLNNVWRSGHLTWWLDPSWDAHSP